MAINVSEESWTWTLSSINIYCYVDTDQNISALTSTYPLDILEIKYTLELISLWHTGANLWISHQGSSRVQRRFLCLLGVFKAYMNLVSLIFRGSRFPDPSPTPPHPFLDLHINIFISTIFPSLIINKLCMTSPISEIFFYLAFKSILQKLKGLEVGDTVLSICLQDIFYHWLICFLTIVRICGLPACSITTLPILWIIK